MFSSGNRKSRRRRGRKKKSNVTLIAGTVALAISVLGGVGYAGYQYSLAERPDQYGCYVRPDQHELVIWSDFSITHQSEAQFRDYSIGAMAAYDRVPANTIISIANSGKGAHSNLIQPVFTLCKPAATAAEQKALGITEKGNLELTRDAETARKKFAAAVESMVEGARDQDDRAENSPVLEQLRSISRAPWFQSAARSLVVITDGLQNSRIAQFCKTKGHMPSFGKFADKPEYRRVKPDSFAGTDVTVLMVESVALPQSGLDYCAGYEEVRRWWEDYFTANDADSVAIEPLDLGVGS